MAVSSKNKTSFGHSGLHGYIKPYSYSKISELAGFESFEAFQVAHKKWVDNTVETIEGKRESCWTESIATGSKEFTEYILSQLGLRAKGRKIVKEGAAFQVREEVESYNAFFDAEKSNIAYDNTRFWNVDV